MTPTDKRPKLSILLGKTDHLSKSFKATIADYLQFFKGKQSAFRGIRKTYEPRPGTVDSPGDRESKLISTTVKEKLDYLVDANREYIDALFAQEATNAANVARAKLVVDGKDMGEYSSLELLRLKSIIENGEFERMYSEIPVRADDEAWSLSTDENYLNKEVFEGTVQSGIKKSIIKESFILPDPNITQLKDSSSYKPQLGQKDTVIELGDYSIQKFTGEWSHRQRAELLGRRTKLLSAVIEALKTANEAESVSSQMTADKLFGYLHEGKF